MSRHSPFFRRLGCLFAIFSVFGITIFTGLIIFVINRLGIIQVPVGILQALLPVAGLFLAFMIVLIVMAGTNLRRMSAPLDDLLMGSNRVAEGDYSTRVDEKGPPEVLSLTRAFNSMANQLQVNDRQRRALLADISHELRTPLTIIQGNLEGVLDGLYPADESRLRSILEETQILSRLIEDLRTLALAESGALQLRREQTDLKALIRDTAEAYNAQAKAAEVNIELSLPEQDMSIEIDPERIRQVLSNLITNALRYTLRGGLVRISLMETNSITDLESKGAQSYAGRNARISVKDSGPGIAPSDIPHIFDRFYKSNDSHGMGLGLSIAKYIIEAHRGNINASSEPGNGTTISFSLPF
jgi:signal transduction histidine kinase